MKVLIMKTSVLTSVKPRYIIDTKGKKVEVVLDVKTFKLLIEELEDLYDVIQAEKILAKGSAEEGKTIDEIEKSMRKRK